MSIKQSILSVPGEYVSLGKLIRGATIIMEYSGTTMLASRDIQLAIRVLFSGEKIKASVIEGTRLITMIASDMIKPNYKKEKDAIRKILTKYGYSKIYDSTIYYLAAIYDNITEYEQEEFEYDSVYLGSDFLEKCVLLVKYDETRLKEKHFECAHKILSPNMPITLNWQTELNKDNVRNIISNYRSNIILTDSFYERLS